MLKENLPRFLILSLFIIFLGTNFFVTVSAAPCLTWYYAPIGSCSYGLQQQRIVGTDCFGGSLGCDVNGGCAPQFFVSCSGNIGNSCSADTQCASGLVCDNSTQKCAATVCGGSSGQIACFNKCCDPSHNCGPGMSCLITAKCGYVPCSDLGPVQ